MSSEGVPGPDSVEVVRHLGALLDAIDQGDIAADPSERAYLAGARDALGRFTSG